jgi:hypothetical protein
MRTLRPQEGLVVVAVVLGVGFSLWWLTWLWGVLL